MSDSKLSSRTVLVTGATSGIGYETARLLAEPRCRMSGEGIPSMWLVVRHRRC